MWARSTAHWQGRVYGARHSSARRWIASARWAVPLEHQANGVVPEAVMTVPGVFAGESVFVQMAAWDGTVWGTSFGQVPANQIGYTDVLYLGLVSGQGLPAELTRFTKPAVVPPVPEPGVLAMIVVGGMAMLCAFHRRRTALH